MRDLVYTAFISLDGVVDSPGGGPGEEHRSGGWVVDDLEFVPEAWSLKGEELADTTALMFGRRSYEAFAPVWPGSEDHADYKELPKYVVSTTLSDDDLVDGWGPTTILRSTEDVAALKEGKGGAIFIHGSAELARRLSDSRPDRPVQPARLPRAARCREEPVRPGRPRQADADAAGVGELLERDHEADLRRQALIRMEGDRAADATPSGAFRRTGVAYFRTGEAEAGIPGLAQLRQPPEWFPGQEFVQPHGRNAAPPVPSCRRPLPPTPRSLPRRRRQSSTWQISAYRSARLPGSAPR